MTDKSQQHKANRRPSSGKSAGRLRIFLVFLAVVFQVALVFLLVQQLQENAVAVYVAIQIIAVIDIFFLVGRRQNPSFTIAWILLILLLPVTGHLLYVLWGRRPKHRRMRRTLLRTEHFLEKDPEVYKEFGTKHPGRKRFAGYLGRMGHPLYKNTACTYYPLADQQFPAILEDIEKAKRFVFLEYFILSDGDLWFHFKELLTKKAAQGVEVRILYDDLGSLMTVPENLVSDMAKIGIQVLRFNPIQYSTSRLYLNYRNHQKLAIIDGEIAYTGGANLADEYVNYIDKFGHWKDTAIRLQGDAVWSKTVYFLQMWEAQSGKEQDFDSYRPKKEGPALAPGFYQPFMDGPMNNPDNPAEIMYRSMIYNAREYVYISSPYLVIDKSMMDALCTAALGGTDVRIMTPHRWDKWYVHMVTQSTYAPLLRAGVRIFEYAPGYNHGKTIISDDDHGIMGTINMDYRSFYLHYENAVWMCGTPIIKSMKQDFLQTVEACMEIHLDTWEKRPFYQKLLQGFFKIFAIFF